MERPVNRTSRERPHAAPLTSERSID